MADNNQPTKVQRVKGFLDKNGAWVIVVILTLFFLGDHIPSWKSPPWQSPLAQDSSAKEIQDLKNQLAAERLAAIQAQPAPNSAPANRQVPGDQSTGNGNPQAQPPDMGTAPDGENTGDMNDEEKKMFFPAKIPGMSFRRGMNTPKNVAKFKACLSPKTLVVDRTSPQCEQAGYKDEHGVPVRRCPNKCV